MAKCTNLLDTDGYWLGSDYSYVFTIKNTLENACVDITGWALSFKVKRQAADHDGHAVMSKATGSGITIAGSFNADPAINAQTATVTIADTDTDVLEEGTYHFELKRTDPGAETILAYGALDLIRSVHHA